MRSGVVAGLAAVAAFLALAVSADGARRPNAVRAFKLSGSVRGLYPGAVRTLPVTIRNPYRRHLRVVSLRVRVGKARPGCGAANLRVRPFRRHVVVRPRRKRVVAVVVRMRRSAGDACRGARFQLRFTARGIPR